MITHYLPHQNNVQQIGYKLLSMFSFKGKQQLLDFASITGRYLRESPITAGKERGRGGENPHLSVFMERFGGEQVEGVRRAPTDREELRGGARGGSY